MPAGETSCAFMVFVEEDAAVGAVLLQEAELVARAAGLAEMRRAVDVGRQLVGDELGDLRRIRPRSVGTREVAG